MMYSVVKRENPQNRQVSKYYPTAAYGEEIDVYTLASEISKECTLTEADVVAVILSLLDKMPLYLKNSNRIRLDNFGIFKLSLNAQGQLEEKDVSADDISGVKVLFTPSSRLKRELSDITYTKK